MFLKIDKRFMVVIFWLVVEVVAVNALRVAIPGIKGQTANPRRVPYTVVLAETIIDAKAERRTGVLLTQAVRADGSIMQRLGTAEYGGQEIYLARGEHIQTIPRTGMKSSWSIKAEPDRWSLDPQSLCTKDLSGQPWASSIQILGEENISGYRSVKLAVNKSIAWYALDQGCARIRTRMEFGQNGASEMHLVSLTVGEPDSQLFTVPANYKEAQPSVAQCGGACPPERMTEHLRRLDNQYFAR
jgi:hypothetical protein